MESAVKSDIIFNYYSLAFAADNDMVPLHLSPENWEEGEETARCLELLSTLFEITQEQVREEYQ